MITARQRAILAAVIERYVETAEPVGSAALASDAPLLAAFGKISSATIRNDLAALEDAGLLAHPHTSAGRIPTDAGYRVYINEMLRPRPVRAGERARIRAQIPTPAASMEDALQDATQVLAQLTGYPALASLPVASRDTMRQVQLNPLPPQRLILVLVTAAGRVEHRMLEVESDVPAVRLNTVINFLNHQFSGQNLADLRALRWDEVSKNLHDAAVLQLAQRAWESVQSAVGEIADEQVVVQGLLTLLDEPEFAEIERARTAMRLLQDAGTLSALLRATTEAARAAGGAVVIGSELRGLPFGFTTDASLERFSFVGISYGAGGEVLGTVGVLGPTRMKYAEAVSLVPALAGRLRESLETL
jgi:heat-inducible transcriptional repressor